MLVCLSIRSANKEGSGRKDGMEVIHGRIDGQQARNERARDGGLSKADKDEWINDRPEDRWEWMNMVKPDHTDHERHIFGRPYSRRPQSHVQRCSWAQGSGSGATSLQCHSNLPVCHFQSQRYLKFIQLNEAYRLLSNCCMIFLFFVAA